MPARAIARASGASATANASAPARSSTPFDSRNIIRTLRKFDLVLLAIILVVAAALRVWAPWDEVLGGTRVNFLETDAWYHVRLAESEVRNFPHRVTVDPYAAPDGQYVAVAPLLDSTIATIAFLTQGRDASTAYIER